MLRDITKYTSKTDQKPAIVEAEIGKRIKAIRVEKRFTLENIAAQTGFTKGYLSKVEKSVKSPPVSTLSTIARALRQHLFTPRRRKPVHPALPRKNRGKTAHRQRRDRLRIFL